MSAELDLKQWPSHCIFALLTPMLVVIALALELFCIARDGVKLVLDKLKQVVEPCGGCTLGCRCDGCRCGHECAVLVDARRHGVASIVVR